MLNPYPILQTEQVKPLPLMDSEPLSDFPSPLWSQMDSASRQQLSQMIAELIQRIRLPRAEKKANDDQAA